MVRFQADVTVASLEGLFGTALDRTWAVQLPGDTTGREGKARPGGSRMPLRAMSIVRIEIDEALAALLHQTNQPVQAAAREMIVLELCRRGAISSGKAAELLGTSRLAFIQHASGLGIPYLEMTEDEWAAEKAASESL
jgi:predicted HTH domain antitoxin